MKEDQMTSSISFGIWVACVILLLSCPPARADISMKLLRDGTESYFDQTVYVSGPILRMDYSTGFVLDGHHVCTPGLSIIWNTSTHVWIALNTGSRSYSVESNMSADSTGAGRDFTVIDTNKTTTVSGYKCRHYILTARVLGTERLLGRYDVLAAASLDSPEAHLLSQFYFGLSASKEIKGLPLIIDPPHGVLGKWRLVATDVSTRGLPTTTFDVPKGYDQDQGHPSGI